MGEARGPSAARRCCSSRCVHEKHAILADDGRMPVVEQFLSRHPPAGAYPALRSWRTFDKKPRTEVRGHRFVGRSRNCMARWMACKPGVPRLPPGAFMGIFRFDEPAIGGSSRSCVHEKHRILRFFLGKRSLLVLRFASCEAVPGGASPPRAASSPNFPGFRPGGDANGARPVMRKVEDRPAAGPAPTGPGKNGSSGRIRGFVQSGRLGEYYGYGECRRTKCRRFKASAR